MTFPRLVRVHMLIVILVIARKCGLEFDAFSQKTFRVGDGEFFLESGPFDQK